MTAIRRLVVEARIRVSARGVEARIGPVVRTRPTEDAAIRAALGDAWIGEVDHDRRR